MNTNPGGPGTTGDEALSFGSLTNSQNDGSAPVPGSYLVQVIATQLLVWHELVGNAGS